VSPSWPLPVNSTTSKLIVSTTMTAGTDFTVAAGSAGDAFTWQMSTLPICNSRGMVAKFGDSALAIGGNLANIATNEVAFVESATNSETGDPTGLSNGKYMVDYEHGTIYGIRASNDTTGTIAYKTLSQIAKST
jgi:hypothetical protein